MDRAHDYYQSYSWHQSHDQATVLLLVPYETTEDDVSVVIERHFLVAGVRGQPPIVKGRLYGTVDTTNSVWQLEPRPSRGSARERTTSTTSTASASTHSSFAVVTDPEISSSFAASLENGLLSDLDDPSSSPALSSPVSSSLDEHGFVFPGQRRHPRSNPSHPASPGPSSHHNAPLSLTSSYSSVESLHRASGRLLTLHLEKAESVIWPSLVVGPVPESLSPSIVSAYPWTSSLAAESAYNMDPTSLVLIALDLYDIRESYEEAFEYFVRAWHQARVPSATIRLATHYLPVQSSVPDLLPDTPSSTESLGSTVTGEPTTPTSPTRSPGPPPASGTLAYYLERIGGPAGLAELFLSAGILHLEGAAVPLLSSAYAGLSSLRTPLVVSGSTGHGHHFTPSSPATAAAAASADGWRRDRECARRYFERARALVPTLDAPLLPPESDSDAGSGPESRPRSGPASSSSEHAAPLEPEPQPRRRRRKEASGDLSSEIMSDYRARDTDADDDDDRTWYLYVPGLVGAGAALLVVGFLSLSSWRKSQGGS